MFYFCWTDCDVNQKWDVNNTRCVNCSIICQILKWYFSNIIKSYQKRWGPHWGRRYECFPCFEQVLVRHNTDKTLEMEHANYVYDWTQQFKFLILLSTFYVKVGVCMCMCLYDFFLHSFYFRLLSRAEIDLAVFGRATSTEQSL